jgi:hypothetical protein
MHLGVFMLLEDISGTSYKDKWSKLYLVAINIYCMVRGPFIFIISIGY